MRVNVVNIEEKEILLSIETVENLYRNPELINVMLEEFENPKLLDEKIDQENFIDIMCENYSNEQIITKLHKANLVTNFLTIEVINRFLIKPNIIEKQEIINEIIEIKKEHENKIEKEFVNVKT